jgi:membrane protease YdiL (CAAX protease family)
VIDILPAGLRSAGVSRPPLVTAAAALVRIQVWAFIASLALRLPPRWGLPYLAATIVLFAWTCFGVREPMPVRRRRFAVLRIRPLGRRAPWVLLAAVATVAAHASLLVVQGSLGWLPPLTAAGPLERVAQQPLGWAVALLGATVWAPLMEELGFRGALQRPLERRWGPAAAIAVSAIVFAVVHLDAWGLPSRLLTGLVFGFAAWRTRSVWAAILLHAISNGAVVSWYAADSHARWLLLAASAPHAGLLALVPLLGSFACAVWFLERC